MIKILRIYSIHARTATRNLFIPLGKVPLETPTHETRRDKAGSFRILKDSRGWPTNKKGGGRGGRKRKTTGNDGNGASPVAGQLVRTAVPVSGFQFSPIISSRLESRQASFLYYTLFLFSCPSCPSCPSLPPPPSLPREKTYPTRGRLRPLPSGVEGGEEREGNGIPSRGFIRDATRVPARHR